MSNQLYRERLQEYMGNISIGHILKTPRTLEKSLDQSWNQCSTKMKAVQCIYYTNYMKYATMITSFILTSVSMGSFIFNAAISWSLSLYIGIFIISLFVIQFLQCMVYMNANNDSKDDALNMLGKMICTTLFGLGFILNSFFNIQVIPLLIISYAITGVILIVLLFAALGHIMR